VTDLYSATLNPRGPNYRTWRELLGSDSVPLKSPASQLADFGPPENLAEKNVEVYLLDIKALTLRQRHKLLLWNSQKFGKPIYEINYQLETAGFPIRAADVLLIFDRRAFA
jgi:hypothetical protein